VPLAANLASGELAINYADGKLFYKDSAGVVQVLASKAGNVNVASFSAGTTGFTPSSATTGAVTLAGTLATTNGGTGLTSFTANGVVYASSTSALTTGSALVFDGTNLSIGTNSAKNKLSVQGGNFSFQNATTSGSTSVGYINGYSDIFGSQYELGRIDFQTGAFADSGFILFSTKTGAGALTERMRLDSSGNLLLGTTSTINSSKLIVSNSANACTFVTSTSTSYSLVCQNTGSGATNFVIFQTGASTTSVGSITYNGTITVYSTSSDYRLKEVSGALSGYKERLLSLQPKQGSWKFNGTEFRGFLAHEFADQYPTSVVGEKDAVDEEGNPKYQSIQAGSPEVIADLIALAQEQQTLIQSLKARLDAANL
jgi:hypothetical protein